MATGKFRIWGSKFLVNGGPFSVHSDCCCGPTAAAYKLTPCVEASASRCDHCFFADSRTPRYWTVEISGVSLHADWDRCIVDGDYSGQVVNADTPNGTWRVEFVEETGGQCYYEFVSNGDLSATQEEYHSTDCSGAATDSVTCTNFRIRVYIADDDGLNANVYVRGPGGIHGDQCVLETAMVATYACNFYISSSGEYHYFPNDNCEDPLTFEAADLDKVNIIRPGWAVDGAEITITPGDVYGGGACPGGSPIYTDTDLSADVGAVVKLNDGVCYEVEDNPDSDPSDGPVTVSSSHTDCDDCCAA